MARTTPHGNSSDFEFRARDLEMARKMSLAQKGDAGAYRSLLEELRLILQKYHENLARRFGLVNELRTDDLVQDTLLAIHHKRHTYQSDQPFGPWFFAIARYKFIDLARKSRREVFVDDPNELDTMSENLEFGLSDNPSADSMDLERVLASLPKRQRNILTLVKLEGLSIKEVAASFKMSESAVKVTVHRAMKTLQDQVQGGAD